MAQLRSAAKTCADVITYRVCNNHQSAQRIHVYASGHIHHLESKIHWNCAQQAKDRIRLNRKVMMNVTALADIRPCPGSELIIADFCLVLKTMSDDDVRFAGWGFWH